MSVVVPTFSESWHRVAGVKAALRPTVDSQRQKFRGEYGYVLHHSFHNQFFRLRPAAYDFNARLRMDHTTEEFWQTGWDAHRFLRELQVINPHVHRAKHDERNGRPEAITWMLLEGREDLVRYGDVLFLDAMKRDYNRPGWPYIGPCVKDNENMVRVTAECICIAESHAMYQWILEAMEDMEPRFLLSNVRLVFADQLVTDDLLVQLGIKETCLLHGDPHHLLNKVFPDTFGNKYDLLFPCLQIMTNGAREEWEAAFQNASRLLVGFPLFLESLENIHNNPSYCCKWHLKANIFLSGQV